MKNKITCACLLLLSLAGAGPAQTSAFRYQPEKIKVGTVYHYVKTNRDGSHPEQISIRVAAHDRIESFKFHPKGVRAALVVAGVDWTNFSARRLESWQVFAGGKRNLFATMAYDKASKTVGVSIPTLAKEVEKTPISREPFHVYNFDLASLNFAFRHLADPRKSFTVGIADPTFKESPMFHYKGEVEVSYVADESRDGVACARYRIDGKGLDNRGGFIWVNKKDGYFQDIEIDLPDNPDWQTFKFKLERVEQMTEAQWDTFIKAQFKP